MSFIGFSARLFAESIEAAMSDGFEDGSQWRRSASMIFRDFGVPSLSPGIIELRAKYRDEARMLPTQLQGQGDRGN